VGRAPYYLRARYYDPAVGRFLGRDPLIGFMTSPQSLNRYVYALNNPILLADPLGLCSAKDPSAPAGVCCRTRCPLPAGKRC